MKILFLGAGGTGGYYGGRLAQSGADVTFLLRPARAEFIRKNGLIIESPNGTDKIPVKTILAEELKEAYDLIVLSCKAYDLDNSINAIRPAVGENSLIVPFLNGIRHIDILEKEFGASKILGGLVYIFATLKPTGEVLQMDPMHGMVIGARHAEQKQKCAAIADIFGKAKFDFRLSDEIMQDMWEKFTFLCALASSTSLFHGSVGDILATNNGREMITGIYDECCAVGKAAGYYPRESVFKKNFDILTDASSKRTSSMMRDLEAGSKIEADSIVGDMILRGEKLGVSVKLLKSVYTYLQVYQSKMHK